MATATETELERTVAAQGARARAAARSLAPRTTAAKDAALRGVAEGLRASSREILAANAEDLERARGKGTAAAMLDRLALDAARVAAIADAVTEIVSLPDPVGEVISESRRPSGVRVRRVRVPIGVIAMIYEARPNVTAEAAALCLKTGNAVLLRGGSEAQRSNAAIAAVIAAALRAARLPEDSVQIVPSDRDAVRILVQQTEHVDLAIPRGGEALIRFVTEHARVPVVQHYKGVCHLYLDGGCDVAMATRLAVNGKLQKPSACNALECLLVDESDAARVLPAVAAALVAGGCELRADARSRSILGASTKAATEADWGREFLDAILAVRVVPGLDGALAHVARYGSSHTEAICTPSAENAARWRAEVDAACVVVNASTRFHDGGELGLGAEIGIATSRLHWRGPMGLESLTTMKWIVDGEGQVR